MSMIEADTMLLTGMFLAMGAGVLSFYPLCITDFSSLYVIHNWN